VTAFFMRIFGGFGVVLGHLFKPVFKPKTVYEHLYFSRFVQVETTI
jgi:hypothetical protein